MMQSAEYTETLASPRWREFRVQVIRERGCQCQHCWKAGHPGTLEVHHKHYDTLGNESPADVEVLCHGCHEKADKKREGEVATQQWGARVAGYAEKKWGPDWEVYPGFEEAEAVFDDWLGDEDEDQDEDQDDY